MNLKESSKKKTIPLPSSKKDRKVTARKNPIPKRVSRPLSRQPGIHRLNILKTISLDSQHAPVQFCRRGPGEMAREGDADFIGPLMPGWRLTPTGDGAHLVERSSIRRHPDMKHFNQRYTPRYYPYHTPENAGAAHVRLHEATRAAGIELRGGNPDKSRDELLGAYGTAYNSPDIAQIKGDLRTPNSKTVVATNVNPAQAYAALLAWEKQQT